MLQKALAYLVGLKDNKTYEIDGKVFSDNRLYMVEAPVYRRETLEFGSLDAIVQMIKRELVDYEDLAYPLFVEVESFNRVRTFTRPDFPEQKRIFPYTAVCRDANFKEGWRNQQEAIIELKSRFIPTHDTEYLLDLISRVSNDEGIKSEDNGVTQTVTVKKGVSLAQSETVKPRVSLKPFRTFREVPQPESEFILRLDENGRIGLFEADGGIWKMDAKDNIANFLNERLADEVEKRMVTIMV